MISIILFFFLNNIKKKDRAKSSSRSHTVIVRRKSSVTQLTALLHSDRGLICFVMRSDTVVRAIISPVHDGVSNVIAL